MAKICLLFILAATWLSAVSSAEDRDGSVSAGDQAKMSPEYKVLLRTERDAANKKTKSGKEKETSNGKGNKAKKGKGKKAKKGNGNDGKGKAKTGKGTKTKKGNKKKAKTGKGKKAKKGKGKKAKKGKGKKGKAGKNNKSNKGKGKKSGVSKKKKNKKGRKGRKKTGKSTRVQDDSCVTDLAKFASSFGNQASNVFSKAKRTAAFSRQVKSKGDKKDEFKGAFDLVLNAAGGNASTPKCRGEDTSPNDTIADTLETLGNCSMALKDSCTSPFSSNSGNVSACETDANNFRTHFIELFTKQQTAVQICTNVKNASLIALADKVKTCLPLVIAAEEAEKKSKAACFAAFQSCRQKERNAAESVSSCGPSGGLNTTAAKAQMEAATKLDSALAEADKALDDALKAVSLAAGPGDDGTLPSGTVRNRRQADGAGCVAVKDELVKFNKSADATIKNPKDNINEDKAQETTDILSNLSSRGTLVDDLKSCQTTSSKQIVAVTVIVQIRYYIFWCRRWRLVVITVKIQLLVVIFGLPSPAPPPPPPTPTPAVTTRRPVALNRNLKRFLNKF